MYYLLVYCICCIQLAVGVIETDTFFHLNDEIPHGEPRILSVTPSSEPNTISVPIVKPIHGDYFLLDVPEENKHESLENAQQLNEITQKGRQVADGIYIELRKVSQRSVAVLVQDDESVIETAAIYINYILEQHPIIQNDFWLFKYNMSGVTNILSKTSLVDRAMFIKQIRGSREGDVLFTSPQLGAEDGIEDINSGAVFFSILKATRQLPFGSEILLFANGKLADEDLAQLAIRETFNKQIRILAVWQGAYPTQHKEEKLLFEATTLTHGKFFIGNTERHTHNDRRYMTVNSKANPVIAHLTNIRGHRQMRVPIEDGVSTLHISLTNNVHKAYMRTPSGYLIDLLNMTAVVRFARNSYVVKTGETFEIDLALGGGGNAHARPAVGVWLLETDAFVQHHYSVVISARHDLRIETNIVGKEMNDNNNKNQPGVQRRRLQLNINGDYAKIDNVTLLTSNGVRISDDHLKIRIRDGASADTDIETIEAGGNVAIDLAGLPQEQLFIEVRGTDKQGNAFQRVSYYNPVNVYNTFEPITINVGMESQLYQDPGKASNIFFEVTNNRDNPVFMQFGVNDQRSFLHRLYPMRTMVNPHQTVIVTLTTISRGSDDLITFTAFTGSDRTIKVAQIKSASGGRIYDAESPHMWHKYTSSCIEVLLGRCEDRTWTIEVTAQDQETGLMSLISSPEGLYFRTKYISGTTQEVVGVLSGSCCYSSVVLTAVDLARNKRSYVADAYWAPLSAGSIAAIVIGVLLLIAIIAIIVYFLSCGKRKCCRKQSDSMDLPPAQIKYRGPVNSAKTTRY